MDGLASGVQGVRQADITGARDAQDLVFRVEVQLLDIDIWVLPRLDCQATTPLIRYRGTKHTHP